MIAIKRFVESIKTIIKWLPAIYHDRQWDYSFFYDIMDHKLMMMQQFFESGDTHLNQDACDSRAREIKQARALLHRTQNGFTLYWDQYHQDIQEVLGKLTLVDDGIHLAIQFENEASLTESQKAELDNLLINRGASYRAQLISNRHRFFMFLHEHIQGWWD